MGWRRRCRLQAGLLSCRQQGLGIEPPEVRRCRLLHLLHHHDEHGGHDDHEDLHGFPHVRLQTVIRLQQLPAALACPLRHRGSYIGGLRPCVGLRILVKLRQMHGRIRSSRRRQMPMPQAQRGAVKCRLLQLKHELLMERGLRPLDSEAPAEMLQGQPQLAGVLQQIQRRHGVQERPTSSDRKVSEE